MLCLGESLWELKQTARTHGSRRKKMRLWGKKITNRVSSEKILILKYILISLKIQKFSSILIISFILIMLL